jgi:hypothetical protein
MSEQWKFDQIQSAHKNMGSFKAQIRQLQAERDRQLRQVEQDAKRYGPEYADSRAREVQVEIKLKAEKLQRDAAALVNNVKPQRAYYTPEFRIYKDRLIPLPEMPDLNLAILSTTERFWLKTTHEQLKLHSEMAEDFRRYRLQQELASAPPERFKEVLNTAVETSNFAMLGILKTAAAGRTEVPIKTALMDAEQRIQLPEADQKAATAIKEIEDMHHAVESSFREIQSEGTIQDIAAKVEAVQEREAAKAAEAAAEAAKQATA